MSNWLIDDENERFDSPINEPDGVRPGEISEEKQSEQLRADDPMRLIDEELSAGEAEPVVANGTAAAPVAPATAPETPASGGYGGSDGSGGAGGSGENGGRSGWRWEGRPRRHFSAGPLAVVAVVSAIIGSMISMMLFPYVGGLFAKKPQLGAPSASSYVSQAGLTDGGGAPAVYVAQKVGPATVVIVNQQQVSGIWGQRGTQTTGGTGFIIDPNGYIVTNEHVVDSSVSLKVVLADGREFPATVVGADTVSDLAVIKVNATNLPTVTIGDSDKVQVGDIAIAIGNPVDPQTFQTTVTQGIISGLNRQIQMDNGSTLTMLQTDAAINPGNSGGPLCNVAGEVIGINQSKVPESENVEGIGLSIPMNIARPIINELIANGKVAHAWLGVGVAEKDQAQAFYGVNFDHGVYVVQVYQGSPAAAAGLQQGDVITAIDGTNITAFADMQKILNAKKPGQTVTISVLRNGRAVSVTATLAQTPSNITQ